VGQNRNLRICTGAVTQVPYEDRREKVICVGRHSQTHMNGGSAGSGGGTDSSQQVRPLHYLGPGYHSSRVIKPSDYHEGRRRCVLLLSQAPQPPSGMDETLHTPLSKSIFGLGSVKRREEREGGRREGQATSTDSPRRLVLGTYGLALSTIVQGMSALCHFLSPSLSLSRSLSHAYIRDLYSATMCDSNEQIRSKIHSL
jgi:hypothetical protein